MKTHDQTMEKQLAVAREWMDRHEVVLSVLAKGDASPHMTDDLRASLADASKRLEKYKIGNSRSKTSSND